MASNNTPTAPPQPFERLLNFRDVGQTINTTVSPSPPPLKPSLLYRSARPDSATPADRHLLLKTHALHTIIDLRTTTEHLAQQQKLSSAPNTPSTSLGKLPGVTYVTINFNGPAFSRALMRRLSWSSAAKLVALYACGWRTQAIAVLGREVITPGGLAGLARDSLMYCRGEVGRVFGVLAVEGNYPVLVHCTQGKDRTGLVVLLVLLLVGVGREAVEVDYAMSEGELEVERGERVAELREIGLGEEFAGSPREWVGVVAGFVKERFGGVEAYLGTCGVTAEQMAAVRRILSGGDGKEG